MHHCLIVNETINFPYFGFFLSYQHDVIILMQIGGAMCIFKVNLILTTHYKMLIGLQVRIVCFGCFTFCLFIIKASLRHLFLIKGNRLMFKNKKNQILILVCVQCPSHYWYIYLQYVYLLINLLISVCINKKTLLKNFIISQVLVLQLSYFLEPVFKSGVTYTLQALKI